MPILGTTDFASLMAMDAASLPSESAASIENADFNWEAVTAEEREQCLLRAHAALSDNQLQVAGPNRRTRWESGWNENLQSYVQTQGAPDSLTPRYFKNDILRYRGDYIKAASPTFETDFYTVTRQILFSRYLSGVSAVAEFGCGTGTSLLMMADMFPDKRLIGCDWAASSQEILKAIGAHTGKVITGINFDMFAPNDEVPIDGATAVVTLHAMEQLGSNFGPFVDYLESKMPALCVHLEPIVEFYQDTEFDEVARLYHRKRGYLDGFLPHLQELQGQKRARILEARRLGFGGFYQEAYSVVVWEPLHGSHR